MVALVTPMHADGSVDLDSLSKLVEMHVESGTSAIVSMGTTGESATLDMDEHCEVMRRTVEIDFMAVSSYTGQNTTGVVKINMDLHASITDRHVLIVEDIVDTGHTLKYLIGLVESHRPASVSTCALVRKAERAEVDVNVDYLGFDIGDEWVVGYGLDFAEKHRTLPYIATIKR